MIIISLIFFVSVYLFSLATGESYCGLLAGIFFLFVATVRMLLGGA